MKTFEEWLNEKTTERREAIREQLKRELLSISRFDSLDIESIVADNTFVAAALEVQDYGVAPRFVLSNEQIEYLNDLVKGEGR